MKFAHLLAAGMVLAAAPALSQPAQLTPAGVPLAEIDRTTITDEIPIGDRGDRMTVAVSVGGNGPYRFLVDTGSERTVISRQLADRLKLTDGRTTLLHSVIGATSVQTVFIPGLKVSNSTISVANAPALEAAHIGLAMGRRGTDVAREAADLVLLDDSFASIVGGVRLGRRIFANLRKALIYITAIHVPIAGLALAPILLGMPPLLFPMHVVLLELAIDPMCSLVFEGEASDPGAMSRPPRRPDEPLFGPRQLGAALIQGALVFAGVLGLYAWALEAYPEPEARGAAFLALVIGNLALALADTASHGARMFASFRRLYWFIAGATVMVMALVLTAPALAALFRVALPPGVLLATACTVGLVSGGALGAALRLIHAGREKKNALQTSLENPLAR